MKLKKPTAVPLSLCLRLCSHLFELNTQQLPTTKLLRKLLDFFLSLSFNPFLSVTHSLSLTHTHHLASPPSGQQISSQTFFLCFLLRFDFYASTNISTFSSSSWPLSPKMPSFSISLLNSLLFTHTHSHAPTLALTLLSFTVKFSYRVESKYRVFCKTKIQSWKYVL